MVRRLTKMRTRLPPSFSSRPSSRRNFSVEETWYSTSVIPCASTRSGSISTFSALLVCS